jgi:hypothetical protein
VACPPLRSRIKIRARYLMITRRFIAQAKAQNWFAAALEIIIVLVGVFLGIEASNWNQQRNDRERGRAYLTRIDSDLAVDIAKFDDALAFWKRVSDYGMTALRFADTGSTGDMTPWQVVVAFFQASQVGEFTSARYTFDEMRSAGQIGLISSVELRSAISRYYGGAANPTLSERPPYREHVRGLIPIDVQMYIWSHCYRTLPDGTQELTDCDSPIPQEKAAEIAAMIRQNAPVMAELRYWVSTLHVASLIARGHQDGARRVRQMIAETRDKR